MSMEVLMDLLLPHCPGVASEFVRDAWCPASPFTAVYSG